jgi:hypothetical protein
VGVVVHPVAGALLFAGQNNILTEIHPAVAMAAGVVVAGGFHAGRAAVRPVATASTGGIANPILSFLEDIVSLILTALAILAPLVAFALFVLLLVLLLSTARRIRHRLQRKAP